MFYFAIYHILLYHTRELCLTITANGHTDNNLMSLKTHRFREYRKWRNKICGQITFPWVSEFLLSSGHGRGG